MKISGLLKSRRRGLVLLIMAGVIVAGFSLWRLGCSVLPRRAAPVSFAMLDDERFGFAAAAQSGEAVFVARDLSGMVYLRPDGETAVIMLGENGLPRRIFDSGFVIEIANYREDLMDVAVTAPDGKVHTVRDVRLPSAVSDWMAASSRDASFDQALLMSSAGGGKPARIVAGPESILLSAQIRSDLLQRPSDWVTIAGIGLGIGLAATAAAAATPVVAVALVLTAGVTSGLSLASMLTDDSRAAWGAAGIESALCASTAVGNVAGSGSCLIAGIGIANEVFVKKLEAEITLEDLTRLARSSLLHGTGDVQLTLTWNAACDLDLWCLTPSGRQVGFRSMRSPCGGQLDFDNREGYGPENIFWPRGAAPPGIYQVWVHHYAGSQSADYRALVRVDGREETLTGRLSPGQTSDKHKFMRR